MATSVVHWGKEMSYNNYLVRGLGRVVVNGVCVVQQLPGAMGAAGVAGARVVGVVW